MAYALRQSGSYEPWLMCCMVHTMNHGSQTYEPWLIRALWFKSSSCLNYEPNYEPRCKSSLNVISNFLKGNFQGSLQIRQDGISPSLPAPPPTHLLQKQKKEIQNLTKTLQKSGPKIWNSPQPFHLKFHNLWYTRNVYQSYGLGRGPPSPPSRLTGWLPTTTCLGLENHIFLNLHHF